LSAARGAVAFGAVVVVPFDDVVVFDDDEFDELVVPLGGT
jgi:hypothetical protein